jgi:hypothetical protein
MTPKSFVYLAGAAALSALLAVVTFAANNPWGTGPIGGEKLMPTLADSIGKVAAVEIRQGDDAVVLERADGAWKLKSRGGYPVDAAKVRTLLVGLGQAELTVPKTSRPDKYAALELENPAEKGAKSHLIRVLDASGNAIAEAVLGKKRVEGYGTDKAGGTYVRRPGNPQTWLSNVDLDAPLAAKDWVKTAVLALESDKISRIGIEVPGEPALRIERAAPAAPKDAKADSKADAKDAKAPAAAAPTVTPGKLAFVGLPGEGKKLKDASAPEAIARAVSSIDLEDVRQLAAPPTDGVSLVKVETADGLAATLRLRKDGDAQWLSVTAAGGDGDARKAADEINAHTQGWEFKIPSYKADLILKKRADLLEASGS